jgi:beta-mannosidase
MKKEHIIIKLVVYIATIVSAMVGNNVHATASQFLVHFDLNGPWQVTAVGTSEWFPANVPGCIHTDLLAAKRIADPFFRDNEKQVQWVGEQAWTYRRTFQLTDEFCAQEHILLRCEGLDTYAAIYVNGNYLGRSNNMFRTWEYDLKVFIKSGTNTIDIQFSSVLPYCHAKEIERHLPTMTTGQSYVRKMPCNFGWDWGPTLITCGIWRNISLVAFGSARLNDVQILQDHSQKGKVRMTFNVCASPVTKAILKAIVKVITPNGNTLSPLEIPITNGNGAVGIEIDHPMIWWPAGMGKQPLYTVAVELQDERGKLLDTVQKRVGLRTLRAFEKTKTEPMQFVVNGVQFFAKGANWIPADAFPNRLSKDRLRRYVADAAAVNMNMLRFWGGGYYEDDELFNSCDELGICVWMDFKFACSTYPVFDSDFLSNVQQEATEQVKRLRHHPSIAVWCGNNEIGMYLRGGEVWTENKMSSPDYYRLFGDLLGGIVRSLSPQTDYVTGSPDCGDVHSWGVWHGGKPFEQYRNVHGFVSEFGFQAFPVPATVNAFTLPEDRTNVYSPIIKYHQRSDRESIESIDDGTIGTNKMMNILRMYFREPKDFESTLWLSQINQAYGIEFAAEGWRREMPKSSGCVYWQYNDTWPGTSWSSVDYFGRWKALHYRAKHFYSPVMVSGIFDKTSCKVVLWLTSDELKPITGKMKFSVTDLLGNELLSGTKRVNLGSQQSRSVSEVELSDLIQKKGANNLIVWMSFDDKGKTITTNLVMLVNPRELELMDPELSFDVLGSETEYMVTVHAKHPALWVWLDIAGMDVRFSDNFIHVLPGSPERITVKLTQPMAKDKLIKAIKVRSLYDTYNVQTR